jgi:hypothetical protein
MDATKQAVHDLWNDASWTARFSQVNLGTVLTHGDLLSSQAGQRHRGPLLAIARRLWPRWLIRLLFRRHGLFLLVTARE